MRIYVLKRNDTQPIEYFLERFTDQKVWVAAPLSGATVRFLMRTDDGTNRIIVASAATIVDAAAGHVQYGWQASDTATAGLYKGEWEVTYPGGAKETFPRQGYIPIRIEEDLG